MILIGGVTGRVGSATAMKLLEDPPMRVRGLTRDAQKAGQLGLPNLAIVEADLANRSAVAVAMEDVDRALLVVGNSEQQFELECNFINAATEAGVGHIVKVSSMEAGPEAVAPIPRLHHKAESLIKDQAAAWTMLQPNFFMQNFLLYAQSIKAGAQFALPFGQAKVSPVDCADVGAAAASVLRDPRNHVNKTYQLTGGELIDFEQIAQVMSQVLGKSIQYVDQAPAEFEAFLAQFIPSRWHVNAVCTLFAQIKQGALEHTSNDLVNLIGSKPQSLTEFFAAHRRIFQ